MTSRERIARILRHEAVDRIAVCEEFWFETHRKWAAGGHVRADESLEEHFGHDLRQCWALDTMGDLGAGETILEEQDENILVRNGNGAVLRWHKDRTGTPEHVDFAVKDRASWEELIRPYVTNPDDYARRGGAENYRKHKRLAAEGERFFCWSGVNVFECMHPVCGHEYMLMGMALDPDWVRDMCEVYAELIINVMEVLFAAEGKPDGVWFYEDMGFKQRPFMSPAMYRDIVWPSHKRTFDYVHSLDLPVIVHSCGFVEPLVEGLIDAGMDCLEAMEVKAGMDLVEIKKKYGDRIALCGGLDVRALESNDLAAVQTELDAKLPAAMAGGGYILHTDHSISPRVDYETYRFFVERGLEMGTY